METENTSILGKDKTLFEVWKYGKWKSDINILRDICEYMRMDRNKNNKQDRRWNADKPSATLDP